MGIEGCDDADPEKRVTVAEALRSPFFDDIRNEENERHSQQIMSFPFEDSSGGSVTGEKMRLRRLIYGEALQFA